MDIVEKNQLVLKYLYENKGSVITLNYNDDYFKSLSVGDIKNSLLQLKEDDYIYNLNLREDNAISVMTSSGILFFTNSGYILEKEKQQAITDRLERKDKIDKLTLLGKYWYFFTVVAGIIGYLIGELTNIISCIKG